ncbi:DNA-directed RNA polymerase I subunit RPA43-like [Oppia nitens]|uniref:DNA-directed RNA polymerase I subunit RPA43-like n=1 Tax=Oppia nitens TaxID=1686743 RepID=UPI0023DCD378|nr:DNA-directed RNA polymerase I subunit RPA43-like [Oppia nitens]
MNSGGTDDDGGGGGDDQIIDESCCFETIYRELEIALDPKFIGNEERAIHRIVDNMKYKYNNELKGILLDYSHLKFVSDLGRIIDDQPYIYWTIGAHFNTSNIIDGQLIRGKINKMGSSYCGTMIGGCIDATIYMGDDVDENLVMPYIRLDQEIIFRVQRFESSNCFIEGIIDAKCFDKIKQLIPLVDNYFE